MILRRIQPMPYPNIVTPDLGPKPTLEWVSPEQLYVDATYQRDLSRRSVALINGMIKSFAWNRMKPPIVVRTGGKLHVIDGQHTAIVAATLRIPLVPVFIVRAEAVDERARAFVGHNTDRITVSSIDVYKALVASGDPKAKEVELAMKQAGVTLRIVNQSSAINVGDTMAIGTIKRIIKASGFGHAVKVMTVLVDAKRAPIVAAELLAVHELLRQSAIIPKQTLARVIRVDGPEGMIAAAVHAKQAKKPLWKALTERWRRGVGDVRSNAA